MTLVMDQTEMANRALDRGRLTIRKYVENPVKWIIRCPLKGKAITYSENYSLKLGRRN